MQEFERQNEKMEMVTEVMGDAIDDAFEGDEEEEETEELVSQVVDKIGIDINSELVKAPSSAVTAPAATNKVAQLNQTGMMVVELTMIYRRVQTIKENCN